MWSSVADRGGCPWTAAQQGWAKMRVTGGRCRCKDFWIGGCRRAPAYRFLVLNGVLEQHAHQQAPLAEAGVSPHLLFKKRLNGCAVCSQPRRSRRCPKPRMPVGLAQNGLGRTHLCSCLCPPYLLLHLHCGFIGKADLESLTQDSNCMRVPARQCPQPACPGTACCLGRSMGSAPPPSDGWQLSTSRCLYCLEPPLHSPLCRSGQVK